MKPESLFCAILDSDYFFRLPKSDALLKVITNRMGKGKNHTGI
jgi:hypothetical protein